MRRFYHRASVFLLLMLPYCAAFGQGAVLNMIQTAPGTFVPVGTDATSKPMPVDAQGIATVPQGATSVTVPANGTTLAVVATMPAVATKTNYLCGFYIDTTATGAILVGPGVTGLLGGTLTIFMTVPASPAVTNYTKTFSPCLPASAVNTAIVLTSGAAGAGGSTSVTVWGFVR